MSNLLELRSPISKTQKWVLGSAGVGIFLAIWLILTAGESPIVEPGILPHPLRVLTAYADLYHDNRLVPNTFRSLGLNLAGYITAILISVPVGFVIGLFGLFRGAFQSHVDAIRFIPLTAVTGLFLVWFGIGTFMKVSFLAFGIIIYLLPVIVVRIDEVEDVYLKTVYTLKATNWQTIKTVYFPSVMSRISDDIRVLTAISWTYIIVAEGIGDQGGLGSLIFRTGQRMGRADKTFAILILIIIIGIFQDKVFAYLDRKFFPHKYQTKASYKETSQLKQVTVWDSVFDYVIDVLAYITIAIYLISALNELFGFIENFTPISYLFGDTSWVIHFIFIIIIGFRSKSLIQKYHVKP
jgi:ABC-type nitrate/sulfonate/bicarbonate transport system permease component